MSDVHTVGSRVWVRDEADSWKKGEVIKLEGESLVIKVEGGQQVSCKPEEAPIQNPDTRGGVEVGRRGYSQCILLRLMQLLRRSLNAL